MNERIKELSKQAKEYAREQVEELKYYGHYMEHNEFDLRFEQKFAELLIKECANICEDNAKTYKYSFKPAKAALAESAANHCAMLIKRTYGVE
jgi:hypothetical protein